MTEMRGAFTCFSTAVACQRCFVLDHCMLDTWLQPGQKHSDKCAMLCTIGITLLVLQEVEDLDRQLRSMSDSHSALAAANGMRQLTVTDKGRSSNKVSAHSIAKKVGLALLCLLGRLCVHLWHGESYSNSGHWLV